MFTNRLRTVYTCDKSLNSSNLNVYNCPVKSLAPKDVASVASVASFPTSCTNAENHGVETNRRVFGGYRSICFNIHNDGTHTLFDMAQYGPDSIMMTDIYDVGHALPFRFKFS